MFIVSTSFHQLSEAESCGSKSASINVEIVVAQIFKNVPSTGASFLHAFEVNISLE